MQCSRCGLEGGGQVEGQAMRWQHKALIDSLKHQHLKACMAPKRTITLPTAGTGTEGVFVCITTYALETLIGLAEGTIE